jgi:UDP-GlcNAc:undecaprenyl-phosphate/decaprenyl-phosphate GlcNAc-1-phosphate transferase
VFAGCCALVNNCVIAGPAVAFFVTFGLICWMLPKGRARLVLDHPNSRSSHSTPLPRTGGVAVMCAVLLSGALVAPGQTSVLGGAGALAVISFLDDWRGLPIAWRLAAQLAVAAAFTWINFSDFSLFWFSLIVFAIVWTTNLYNFMDGTDGLAGGMTLFGFGSYTIASYFSGNIAFACLAAGIAAAAAAFLCFNFHPARIFLGDAGAIPLGFLAAAIGLLGWKEGDWPAWFPFLIFSPFIVDASVTLIRRVLAGERILIAHQSHYYQRLARMAGHRKTAVAEYLLMIAVATSALFGSKQPISVQIGLFGAWICVYVALALLIDRMWWCRRRKNACESRKCS